MPLRIKCVVLSSKQQLGCYKVKFSEANAKFVFITFDESCDKTCSKIGKTCFPLVAWQKSVKNDE